MPFLVQLTDDVARDLEKICDYIDRHDSPASADYVLDRTEKTFSSLSDHPRCGSYPKELLDIGTREYQEVFFKPYRIIYRVIVDGRRDMRVLLEWRPTADVRAEPRYSRTVVSTN